MLHSINVLRQPGSINWGKDAVHDFQIATTGISSGHFIFGNPNFVSHSYDQSFYPGLEFLMSSLNLVTDIPLLTLYNYAFVILNVLTLVFFYLLLRSVLRNRVIINTAVLFYALCPQFNYFDSFSLHESLAIVLFPLVLMVILVRRNNKPFDKTRMAVIGAFSIFLITITNEFTTYVLAFSCLIIVVAYLFVDRFKKENFLRENLYKLLLLSCLFGFIIWVDIFCCKLLFKTSW